MKERPILFSADMVRAILAGRKTQTRRVIKPQPGLDPTSHDYATAATYRDGLVAFMGDRGVSDPIACPYGQVGDRLYVKETHYRYGTWAMEGFNKSGSPHWVFVPWGTRVRFYDDPPDAVCRGHIDVGWYKRPSIFLPRWASRITLEITGVKVERVQDITTADAEAEGVDGESFDGGQTFTYRGPFAMLWDAINFKRGYGWLMNPWDWALTFKVAK